MPDTSTAAAAASSVDKARTAFSGASLALSVIKFGYDIYQDKQEAKRAAQQMAQLSRFHDQQMQISSDILDGVKNLETLFTSKFDRDRLDGWRRGYEYYGEIDDDFYAELRDRDEGIRNSLSNYRDDLMGLDSDASRSVLEAYISKTQEKKKAFVGARLEGGADDLPKQSDWVYAVNFWHGCLDRFLFGHFLLAQFDAIERRKTGEPERTEKDLEKITDDLAFEIDGLIDKGRELIDDLDRSIEGLHDYDAFTIGAKSSDEFRVFTGKLEVPDDHKGIVTEDHEEKEVEFQYAAVGFEIVKTSTEKKIYTVKTKSRVISLRMYYAPLHDIQKGDNSNVKQIFLSDKDGTERIDPKDCKTLPMSATPFDLEPLIAKDDLVIVGVKLRTVGVKWVADLILREFNAETGKLEGKLRTKKSGAKAIDLASWNERAGVFSKLGLASGIAAMPEKISFLNGLVLDNQYSNMICLSTYSRPWELLEKE